MARHDGWSRWLYKINQEPVAKVVSASEVENLKFALARMWFAYQNKDEDNPHDFELEAVKLAEKLLGPWQACMTRYF